MFAQFKSLIELFDFFKDEETCLTYWENVRWSETGVLCPHCGGGGHYKTNRGYKCKNIDCQKKFTAIVGSIFENTKIPLRKWFGAIYLFDTHKKGISSLQLSTDLKIHQKSAWFLLHRIRETMKEIDALQLGGEGVIVEVDSTIVGGKVKNMSNKKRKEIKERIRSVNDNKTPILGVIERSGKIHLEVIKSIDSEKDLVKERVDKGSVIMTDSATTYTTIGKEYAHHGVVDHSKSEYVKDKVYHTNTIEGAFSQFDRMYIGTYHYISNKHMQSYANECAYRYNTRKITQSMRFENTIMKCDKVRLKYDILTGK